MIHPGSKVRLFGDDCVLYRKIKSIDGTTTQQKDLDSLQKLEKGWLMAFHPDKCPSCALPTNASQ